VGFVIVFSSSSESGAVFLHVVFGASELGISFLLCFFRAWVMGAILAKICCK